LISEKILLSREFPGRPKTAKGAIIALRPDSKGPIDPSTPTFVFQYNPETLMRTVSSIIGEEPQSKGKKPVANSIVELINLNLEFDAADQLEQPNQHLHFVEKGLHPTLAALESIMHSQSETDNPTPPVVLFLWGPNRIIPVWLDNLKVTEEAFDPDLNPIRVRIELNMRVRDLSELKEGSLGYAICTSHLDHRRMFTRLYSETGINREFLEQVSSSVQQYLAIGRSQSKERKKKRLRTDKE
jgi:hypothetical protein